MLQVGLRESIMLLEYIGRKGNFAVLTYRLEIISDHLKEFGVGEQIFLIGRIVYWWGALIDFFKVFIHTFVKVRTAFGFIFRLLNDDGTFLL